MKNYHPPERSGGFFMESRKVNFTQRREESAKAQKILISLRLCAELIEIEK